MRAKEAMQDRARQRRRCKEEAKPTWQYKMSKGNSRQGEAKRRREATQESKGERRRAEALK
jgi:hypothetical protein